MAIVVNVRSIHDPDDDVAFWLAQPPQERIAAVEVLRRMAFGIEDVSGSRLQRVCRVVRRT
jgi:hypothetical protein